uniref:Uncharacterized protein n=1 Tax=Romanomermis culicivorax TaxID=13658 RepID=A0A915JP44_ROMCU
MMAYHLKCNSMVKLFNQTLIAQLKKYNADDPDNWEAAYSFQHFTLFFTFAPNCCFSPLLFKFSKDMTTSSTLSAADENVPYNQLLNIKEWYIHWGDQQLYQNDLSICCNGIL